jgi:hypothetical protein
MNIHPVSAAALREGVLLISGRYPTADQSRFPFLEEFLLVNRRWAGSRSHAPSVRISIRLVSRGARCHRDGCTINIQCAQVERFGTRVGPHGEAPSPAFGETSTRLRRLASWSTSR